MDTLDKKILDDIMDHRYKNFLEYTDYKNFNPDDFDDFDDNGLSNHQRLIKFFDDNHFKINLSYDKYKKIMDLYTIFDYLSDNFDLFTFHLDHFLSMMILDIYHIDQYFRSINPINEYFDNPDQGDINRFNEWINLLILIIDDLFFMIKYEYDLDKFNHDHLLNRLNDLYYQI